MVITDLADLVLSRACLRCTEFGPALCPTCLASVRGHPILASTPLPVTVAAAPYAGLVRDAVLAYKEDGWRGLSRPLGWLMADGVWVALQASGATSCAIVPVPGHRRPRRGHDALGDIVRHAHRCLVGAGMDATIERLLRTRRDYAPLKSSTRPERLTRVAGAFTGIPGRWSGRRIVLVDDVVTTGATALAAAEALERAGLPVTALAAIALTPPSAAQQTWRG